MHSDIEAYNAAQTEDARAICDALAALIDAGLTRAQSKLWHGGPVWFLADNPVVGYWVRKKGVQLLFWSGQSFSAKGLKKEGSFKAAEARYTAKTDVDVEQLAAWLAESRDVQWDYANIVKRKGKLVRLK